MIIAIDGYEANVERRVGIGRYAFALLHELYRLGKERVGAREKIQFLIYLPQKPRPDMPRETFWWQYRVIPMRRLWTFIGLPLGLVTQFPRPDVVFSPTHYAPRFVAIPKVISIMDLSYLSYPELFRKKDLHQLTHWTAFSALHARRILTISAFSRRAIIEAYHTPEDRVVVTYPGFSMDTKSFQSDIRKKYKLRSSYILSVGTIQPRKNYARLIEAFAAYCRHTADTDTDLVIVGKRGWLYDSILEAPKAYKVEDRVKFLSFVPDADLPGLYGEAACFCLPSLYEGFGLPVLEAMASSCPVVVSNTSSLPEIAGKAGIYVDPLDVGSIEKGIAKAMKERVTKEGENRIRLGHEQVKKFTWEKAAKDTLDVLEEAARGANTTKV